MTLETKMNDDSFSAAFDRLAELGNGTPQAESDALTNFTKDEGTETTIGEDDTDDTDDTAPEVTDDDTGDESDSGDDADEQSEPESGESDEELLARLASLIKKAPVAEEPVPTVLPQATEQAEPIFSEEEQQFLSEYERDWPDVARAEALRRRAEYRDIVGYVFQEIAKELSPIMDAVQTLSTRTHLQDLQEVVTDYDDVRDKVIDWVATQPKYLQPAYAHVIQNGTVDEVADLISRYKEATGTRLAAPGTSKKETELPTATKQAAASLAPVSSKRSAVIQANDPGDFDSAFAAFADKL